MNDAPDARRMPGRAVPMDAWRAGRRDDRAARIRLVFADSFDQSRADVPDMDAWLLAFRDGQLAGRAAEFAAWMERFRAEFDLVCPAGGPDTGEVERMWAFGLVDAWRDGRSAWEQACVVADIVESREDGARPAMR